MLWMLRVLAPLPLRDGSGGRLAEVAERQRAPVVLSRSVLPQPMGAGSVRPPDPLRAEPCRAKGRPHGCEGEKPWHPSPDKRPRERPPREGKPTANEDATRRRKRVWGTETVEEAGKSEGPIPGPSVK
jgi:hypothetical protein